MQLDLQDGEIEMVMTAIRGTIELWKSHIKAADEEPASPSIRRLAVEQVASWEALLAKVCKQYDADQP